MNKLRRAPVFQEVAPTVVAPEVEENGKHKAVVSNLTSGQSVLRNIEGTVAHRDLHFHGLKNVQTVFPQESNGFQVGESLSKYLLFGFLY